MTTEGVYTITETSQAATDDLLLGSALASSAALLSLTGGAGLGAGTPGGTITDIPYPTSDLASRYRIGDTLIESSASVTQGGGSGAAPLALSTPSVSFSPTSAPSSGSLAVTLPSSTSSTDNSNVGSTGTDTPTTSGPTTDTGADTGPSNPTPPPTEPVPPTTDPVPPTTPGPTDPTPPSTDPTPPTDPVPPTTDPTPPSPPSPPAPTPHDPTGTSGSLSGMEDSPITLTAAAFGFADADGDTLAAVKVTVLPTSGSLAVNGVPVSAGQEVPVVDIAAGHLVYSPAADANGTGVDSLGFCVKDSSGAVDTTSRTLAINLTAINDAPNGGDTSTVSGAEDAPYVFSVADFRMSDSDAGDSISKIRIDVLPAAGTLRLNGAPLTAGVEVSASDISGGRLTFEAAADANGTGYATINYTPADQAGAYANSANSLTIDVSATQDRPTGTSSTISMLEDGSYAFTAADFGFTDADAGDTLTKVRIDTLPGVGTLRLGGVAVTAGQEIAVADLGNLVFEPATGGVGIGYASIGFSVSDGTDWSAASSTLTVDVGHVNHAPTGTSATITTLEDTTKTLSAADFGFSDPDSGDNLAAVKITSLPGAGALKLSGAAVSVGDVISRADIDAGHFAFAPAANANGSGYASIGYRVQDSAGTFAGAAATLTVDVTPVNDAPTISITLVGASIDDSSPVGTVVATINSSDPDGDLPSRSLTGAHAGKLVIVGNEVRIAAALNAGADPTLGFGITADDGHGGTASASASVAVVHSGPSAVAPAAALWSADADTNLYNAVVSNHSVNGQGMYDILGLAPGVNSFTALANIEEVNATAADDTLVLAEGAVTAFAPCRIQMMAGNDVVRVYYNDFSNQYGYGSVIFDGGTGTDTIDIAYTGTDPSMLMDGQNYNIKGFEALHVTGDQVSVTLLDTALATADFGGNSGGVMLMAGLSYNMTLTNAAGMWFGLGAGASLTADLGTTAPMWLYGGAGVESYTMQATGTASLNVLDMESIKGTAGADSITVNTYHPSQDNDVLVVHAGGGNDNMTLRAGHGRIDVYGDAGADLIVIQPTNGDKVTDVHFRDFDEAAGDRIKIIGANAVKLTGTTDNDITLEADYGSGFVSIGHIEGGKSADGTLNGDATPDALTAGQLAALQTAMIANGSISV